MVLAASPPFSGFVSQPYSPAELLRCWVFLAFDKLKTVRFNAAPFAGKTARKGTKKQKTMGFTSIR